MTPPRAPRSSLLATVFLVLGLVVYMELRLTSAVNRMRETAAANLVELTKVQRTLQLLRIEQSSEGKGIDALLEMIVEFAPHMQRQTALTLEYESRMKEVMDVIEDLGEESYAAILTAFRDTEPGEQDELRRWLLEAMVRADPERAEEQLVSILRGVDPNFRSLEITARNRQNAAFLLVEMGKSRPQSKSRAADVLASIFSYETARGVNPARVPFELKNRVPAPGNGIGNGFDAFVNWYLATEDPDGENPEIETNLIRILKSNEHTLLAKQTAVKWLGANRVRDAAGAIEDLYLNDPEGRTRSIFRNHCLDALGSILGGEACEFFRTQSLEVDNELVLNKLESLIAELCGSAPR